MPNQEWNGKSYDRISAIQQGWGEEVLGRLELDGGETALDAGCGSGRVTELLLGRLPRGRVIAVDASASMVAAAEDRLLGEWGNAERVEVRRADLLDLELEVPVDAIISTATFHWIADHERLFRRLHAALRPGGRLIAQCGGEGNIAGLRGRARAVMDRDAYAPHFAGWVEPWNYAGAQESERRLRAAGFTQARCWLSEAPATPAEPREFLATIVLGPHVAQLPARLREPFMDEVMDVLGTEPCIDYVRLNIEASA
jgi:trans-aconitate 2-methyltransferase